MSILVLGGDGYLGWPLAMRMARLHSDQEVVVVDNLTRRRLVQEVGGSSISPILDLEERIEAFASIFGQRNLTCISLDLAGRETDALFAHYRPNLVYHFAQVGSAAYSMKGPDQAVFTVENNECGHMRVLWAMRRHCPQAHLVKSGSLGQYAKCGLEIPEGYFQPSYLGKTASSPVLFPRQSDDVYHVSKINDTNYTAMACRSFGLRVTDVMQSTVFGVHTQETRSNSELLTRFDTDEYFGTVVNRFLAQVVIGHPLTVYGSGWQRTGLMALEDAMTTLQILGDDTPPLGVHRVVNSVTEKNFCIREIASQVLRIARGRNLQAQVTHLYDPRHENEMRKQDLEIRNKFVTQNVQASSLDNVLVETMDVAVRFRDRILPQLLIPSLDWRAHQ